MAGIVRLTDSSSGHDDCGEIVIVENCSEDVFTNKLATGRVGSILDSHFCDVHPEHFGTVSTGSMTVYTNGIPMARIGSLVSCGGNMTLGSPNVSVGD